MEALEELVRQRDATIAELERLNAEKDARIRELLSQLDKYKSVLLFAGTPGLPSGVFMAPSVIPISRKQKRAWGISAEPPSSHSSRSGKSEIDGQPCQKFYKDQGSVRRICRSWKDTIGTLHCNWPISAHASQAFSMSSVPVVLCPPPVVLLGRSKIVWRSQHFTGRASVPIRL